MLSLGANLNRFFKADDFYNLKDWGSVGFFHALVKKQQSPTETEGGKVVRKTLLFYKQKL